MSIESILNTLSRGQRLTEAQLIGLRAHQHEPNVFLKL